MNCPYCGSTQTKVVETRDILDGTQKRRYRKCITCGKRFVTYEKVVERQNDISKR